MKKAILLTIALLLLPGFASAEFSYSKFDSFLLMKTAKLRQMRFQFALAAAKEKSQKSHEYSRNYSKIAGLIPYLENLKRYVRIRPLIASDKMDRFEDSLLRELDNTLEAFNREISSNQANRELEEIVLGLNYFKKHLQKT